MDLDEIRLFLAVVQHGAFNAAAESLRVSRSTLRRRVDALEARAGTPLLHRTPQGIHLTEAGRVLSVRGRTLIEGASALVDSLRDVGHEPAGVLRVVMPVGSPPHLLTEFFLGFRAAFPRLRFVSRFSEAPLSEALTDTDVVFHFDARPPSAPWLSEPLMSMPLQLRAAPGYLARRGCPESVNELSNHDLLVWHPPTLAADRLPLISGGTMPVEPVLASTDANALWHACLAGAGLAFLPVLVDMDAAFGAPREDRRVLENAVGGECTLYASVPEALADIPKVRVVLEWTRAYLAPGRA